MLPPGLGFNAVSNKALAAAKSNPTSRSYWDWHDIIQQNKSGGWPYTPATNLLYGLKEAIAMLTEDGLDNVFVRHLKLAAATRAAVRAWNLEILCQNPEEYSPILTVLLVLNGPCTDQLFWQLPGDELCALADADDRPLTFAAWYTGWLLAQLALHERLVELMGQRTPLPALHAALAPAVPAAIVDRTVASLLDRPSTDGLAIAYTSWLARRTV